jgi:hypothetical protein
MTKAQFGIRQAPAFWPKDEGYAVLLGYGNELFRQLSGI